MRNPEVDRLRTQEQLELAALRKAAERMAAQEHQLEEELERLDDDIVEAKEVIDVYLRPARRSRARGGAARPSPRARGHLRRRR